MNLLEAFYYLGFSAKKYYSLLNRKKLPCKVISVGNITVGGTGKTPATIAIAEKAKQRGLFPVILTRGYRGKAKGPCFVTEGGAPLLSVDDAGDEPFLMAGRLKGVPIVKGGNRYESGVFALRHFGTQSTGYAAPPLFILDDGFQHIGLQRDKDIVLIDAGNPFGNRMLLPLGRLREPVRSIGRADIIVLTKSSAQGDDNAGGIESIKKEIRRYNKASPIFLAEHVPVSCRLASGEEKPPGWLSGKRLFGFCALGNPESFKKTVLSTGAELAGFRSYRDHYRYEYADIESIKAEAERCGAGWIVTTEKDIIKIEDLDLPENILIMEIAFSAGEGFYEEVFSL